MAKKESNVLQRSGTRLIQCAAGNFNMHVCEGVTVRDILGFTVKHRKFSLLGAYELVTVDGRKLEEDDLLPSDETFIFRDLGRAV